MPKVSVIVPVYKVEPYIEKCICSLINQTLKDIEIILVDDGSPDNCGIICDKFAKQDSRIIVIHKENGGLSDARNAGMKVASGEFLGFVDSDDYVSQEMFELLYTACIDQKAEIAGCDLAYVYENDNRVVSGSTGLTYVLSSDEFYCRMMNTDGFLRVGVWNKIYKMELFHEVLFPKGKLFEDIGTLYKVIFKAQKTVYISKPCYMYLKERTGAITTGNYKSGDLDRLEMGDSLVEYIKNNRPQIIKQVVAFKCVNCNLSVANLMIKSDAVDTKIIKKLQNEVRQNILDILQSGIQKKKKLQLILFAFSFVFYKKLYQRIEK